MGFSALLRPCKASTYRLGQAFVRGFKSNMGSLQVTRGNFWQILPWFQDRIREADFLAVDMEFSGVTLAPWHAHNVFDTADTMYYKVKSSAENFGVLKAGVCSFKWMPDTHKFVAYPFSFCLFQRNDLSLGAVNTRFLSDRNSWDFLAAHGFDFNVCVSQGISYLSRKQESIAKGKTGDFFSKQKLLKEKENQGTVQNNNSADILLAEGIKARVNDWRSTMINLMRDSQSSNDSTKEGGIGNGTAVDRRQQLGTDSLIEQDKFSTSTAALFNQGSTPIASLRPSLVIEAFNDYQAQLALEVINHSFTDVVATVKTEESFPARRLLHVYYTTSMEDRDLLMKQLDKGYTSGLGQIEASVGFRHVIDAIVTSKKPVVGHNCMLDFAHIYDKFFAPLPSTVGQFSDDLLENFPCIIDTRYLVQFHPQFGKERRLFYLYLKASMDKTRRVEIEIADELSSIICSTTGGKAFTSAWSSDQEKCEVHEAGVDAYMTGCLFAKVCTLSNFDARAVCQVPELLKSGINEGLVKHMNLLHFGLLGSMVLDLRTGKELTLTSSIQTDRSLLAFIWGFRSGTDVVALNSFIQKAVEGFLKGPVKVIMVDRSSALVKFGFQEDNRRFSQLLKNPPKDTPNSIALVNSGIKVGTFATYERLCKASLTNYELADCAEILGLGIYRGENVLAAGGVSMNGGGSVRTTGREHSLDKPQDLPIDRGLTAGTFAGEQMLGKEEGAKPGLDVEQDRVEAKYC